MVKFNIADVSQASYLVEMWNETFRQAYSDVHAQENIDAYCRTNFSINQAKAILKNSECTCIIAEKNGQAAGFSIFQHRQNPIKPFENPVELKQLYIRANEYGTGLGKRLVDKTFELMLMDDRLWVWLCVSNLNVRAQKFYNKYGFKRIGNGPNLIVGTDKLASSIMVRKL